MRRWIRYSCCSHIGRVRRTNEDNFICDGHCLALDTAVSPTVLSGRVTVDRARLFGVFDGMGGEECGEVAAYIAATKAKEWPARTDGEEAATAFCLQANEAICEYARREGVFSMGTTAALLLCADKHMTVCNIGDSRLFRLSDNGIEQLSVDHVEMAPFGRKPPLSQHLGIPSTELRIEPHTASVPCRAGERFVICSDGLTDALTARAIEAQVRALPTAAAAQALVHAAMESGSKDNITVIVLEIEKKVPAFRRLFRREKRGETV